MANPMPAAEGPMEDKQEGSEQEEGKGGSAAEFFSELDSDLGKALALLQSAKGVNPDALKAMAQARAAFQSSVEALTGGAAAPAGSPAQGSVPAGQGSSSMEAAGNSKAVPAY